MNIHQKLGYNLKKIEKPLQIFENVTDNFFSPISKFILIQIMYFFKSNFL